MFGYHPHGIIGMGAVGTFGMMTSGFNRLFPGVDVRLLTLKMNFFVPFFDLFITFMGMCDASRDSCNAILGDPEHKSLCLVLGIHVHIHRLCVFMSAHPCTLRRSEGVSGGEPRSGPAVLGEEEGLC